VANLLRVRHKANWRSLPYSRPSSGSSRAFTDGVGPVVAGRMEDWHYPPASPETEEYRVALNQKSRQTIYAGVNYVFAPAPILDGERFLLFQQSLAKHGLSFEQTQKAEKSWTLGRTKPPLLIQAALPGPPIGQVMVTSDWMEGDLNAFGDEAAAVYEGVFETWPGDKQVIAKDATIRQLYDVGGTPAFQYLWEHRLGQQIGQLSFLGRPVAGGGLRLVMPPETMSPEPVQTELRIESFLQDPRKLFVQVSMAWPQPTHPAGTFAPSELISKVEDLANTDVLDFLELKGSK